MSFDQDPKEEVIMPGADFAQMVDLIEDLQREVLAYSITVENQAAEIAAIRQQEPVKYEFQARDGTWHPFMDQKHYENTVSDGSWPIRPLYLAPTAQSRELSNEEIKPILIAHGFKIYEGLTDLKPYVYEAVRAVLAAARSDEHSRDAEIEALRNSLKLRQQHIDYMHQSAAWYEELRKATDGGSESMTHADALKQIAYWRGLTQEMQKRETANESLKADARRIDWLSKSKEAHGFCCVGNGEFRYYAWQMPEYTSVRETIDAAIAAEGGKT